VERVALLDADAELELVGADELGQPPALLLGLEREARLVVGDRVGLRRAGGHVLVVDRPGRPIERREHGLVDLLVVVGIADGVVGLALPRAPVLGDLAVRFAAAAPDRSARRGDEVLHEAEVLRALERLALLQPDLGGLVLDVGRLRAHARPDGLGGHGAADLRRAAGGPEVARPGHRGLLLLVAREQGGDGLVAGRALEREHGGRVV
jgi:hypothetical protein